MRFFLTAVLYLVILMPVEASESESLLPVPQEERYLQNIRQLTFEGINGEGYFSRDMKKIIFQSIRGEHPHYQIYSMDIDGGNQRLLSGNKGKTTCSYFRPDGKKIIYASTMHRSPDASETDEPLSEKGEGEGTAEKKRYQWDFDSGMEIYEADPDGSGLKRITDSDGYDAEGVYSNDGTKIVFTSQRDGDLEIYMMNADGTEPLRLTESKGYDGGAFFSPDDKKIVFRSFRDPEKPRTAQVYIMDLDSREERQITDTEAINWAPYFHPSGRYIIFASNPSGAGKFDLFLIKPDGTGLRQVTYHEGFDGLPYFSSDGKKLLWTSNRSEGKSQLFIADWVYQE